MKAFKCGERVSVSGVYRVSHLLPHPAEHREMYFEGSCFPACKICATGVYYRLESPCIPMTVVPNIGLASAVS